MGLDYEPGELVAIDFDNTLTDPDEDEWEPAADRDPNPPVIEAVREAYRDGAHIVIWTARQWWEAPEIAGWLQIHEVPFHGLRCGKGGADRYVDDKAVEPPQDDSREVVGIAESAKVMESVEFSFTLTPDDSTGDEMETPAYMTKQDSRNY